LSYQKVTGTLTANSHPGSYCGQDAYNDMFVTENKNDNFNKQGGLSHQSELQHNECACEYGLQRSAYDFEGGVRHGYCGKTLNADRMRKTSRI